MTDYGPGIETQDATPKKDRFGVKKMTIRKTLIATLLLLGAPAFALIDAIELTPDNIILPATTSGTMTFKLTTLNQTGEEVMHFTSTCLLKRREAAGA